MSNVNDFLKWVDSTFRKDLTQKYEIASDDYEENSGARRVRVNLYTVYHRYSITAVNKSAKSESYLGCICYNRAPHAGETHLRSRDLSDGSLSVVTWNYILHDIVYNELVCVGAPQFNSGSQS